jgi:GH15 family glucan-1,4-alpha-glucosidase
MRGSCATLDLAAKLVPGHVACTTARMPSFIGNYAFLSNLRGSALVSRDGFVDWLCIPNFDSAACMAALLGRDHHGCWVINLPRGCAAFSGATARAP